MRNVDRVAVSLGILSSVMLGVDRLSPITILIWCVVLGLSLLIILSGMDGIDGGGESND